MKFERRRDSHGLRSQPERNAVPRITALLVSVKLLLLCYCYYNTSRTTAARGHEDGAPPGVESVELPVKEERAWM